MYVCVCVCMYMWTMNALHIALLPLGKAYIEIFSL